MATPAFVVLTYKTGRQQAAEFHDKELARRHMALNAPAELYRREQVRTVVNGVAYLNQFATPIAKVQ